MINKLLCATILLLTVLSAFPGCQESGVKEGSQAHELEGAFARAIAKHSDLSLISD